MTPKEKAKGLISLFGNIVLGETEDGKPYLMSSESLVETKQCVLICLDEQITSLKTLIHPFNNSRANRRIERRIQDVYNVLEELKKL